MTRSRLLGIGLVAMIVLPAVVLAVLGYRSFETEARIEASERKLRVRHAFDRAQRAVSEYLNRVEKTESERPWHDYGHVVLREDLLRPSHPVARRSPLSLGSPWPFVRGHFQFDPARDTVTSPRDAPQTVPSRNDGGSRFLLEVREMLRSHLVDHDLPTGTARVVDHPAAELGWNEPETRSAILSGAGHGDSAAPRRTVPVRYRPFVYSVHGNSVLAVRHVTWTFPNGTPRALLQGFVIEVAALARETLPDIAERAAGDPAVLVRIMNTPPSFYAYPPNRPLGPMLPGISLAAEEADPDRGAASVAAARERFVLLVGALFVVIGVGLFLQRRAVSAELSLARRRADFVSAVSHELRTPLTGIRMYADMLRDGWVKDEETIRHYHESMARESERLSRLVQNVLDFSALEKGRKDYDFERGQLEEPIRAAVDLLSPYLDEKGFEVTLEIDPDLPDVDRDPDAVQQCVVNLVDNAVKYARDHEPKRIVVSLSADDGTVTLAVRDHGPGLSPAERERVFEAFYRGGSKTSREVGGAGLGLALVERFARAHRGRASVDQAEEGGARFRVTFPVV